MEKGYIQSVASVSEFQSIVNIMNSAGIESDNIYINQSFEDFVKTLDKGDRVVVFSLDFFTSISELISVTISLVDKNIEFESLSEPWYSISSDNILLLSGINELGARLRAKRTLVGLAKAKAAGKKLGRPVLKSSKKS
ncbi:MAG: recombinase family protein [Rikenellaceae bacterium]